MTENRRAAPVTVRIPVELRDRKEAALIRRALADPEVLAFVKALDFREEQADA